jgi:ADP-heptose:LPS heptosyltransferase
MTNQGLSKLAFRTLDRLTDRFPETAPAVFQRLFLALVGNRLIYSIYLLKYAAVLKRVKSFDRILLIADVNIGDAITIQQCIVAFRHFFPQARIDYACNQTGGELVSGMPEVDHVFRIFNSGNGFPLENNLGALKTIVEGAHYTVMACFSPFVPKKEFQRYAPFVQMYVPLASHIMRQWREQKGTRHVSDAVFTVSKRLLESVKGSPGKDGTRGTLRRADVSFKGNAVYLTSQAIQRANQFLAERDCSPSKHLLFFNPDATSKYSQIPIALQKKILRQTLESSSIDAVLLGAGHSHEGIESLLTLSLPASLRRKLLIVPHMSISAYAAVIDACDMFLSSDTGPAHIAASRKVALSEYYALKNRTSVVTVFGAGDSRMYGYDSEREGHIPAHQLAPSRVFVPGAPCRNITCINKWGKSCQEVRCFMGLNAQEIVDYVIAYFNELRKNERVVFRRVV